MLIHVKLFSILRECVDGYDPQKGLAVELSPQASVEDLIRQLNIPSDKAPVVSCNGRILKPQDLLTSDSEVNIFQPVAGG